MIFLFIFWERASVPLLMFIAKQGHYWYHVITSLVWRGPWLEIWSGDLPHSKPALIWHKWQYSIRVSIYLSLIVKSCLNLPWNQPVNITVYCWQQIQESLNYLQFQVFNLDCSLESLWSHLYTVFFIYRCLQMHWWYYIRYLSTCCLCYHDVVITWTHRHTELLNSCVTSLSCSTV